MSPTEEKRKREKQKSAREEIAAAHEATRAREAEIEALKRKLRGLERSPSRSPKKAKLKRDKKPDEPLSGSRSDPLVCQYGGCQEMIWTSDPLCDCGHHVRCFDHAKLPCPRCANDVKVEDELDSDQEERLHDLSSDDDDFMSPKNKSRQVKSEIDHERPNKALLLRVGWLIFVLG
jgi:hypothetical protein